MVENVEVSVETVADSEDDDEKVLIIEEELPLPDVTPLFPLHEPDVTIGLKFWTKGGATAIRTTN